MSEQRLTHHEFTRAIWRAIAPPLVLLAAHAVLLSMLLLYWLRSGSWLQHSEQFIARIYDLERLLVNMETGYRGYLLTQDETFLEPYKQSKARFPNALKEARAMGLDNENQIRRLDEIGGLYESWIAYDPYRETAQAPRSPPA